MMGVLRALEPVALYRGFVSAEGAVAETDSSQGCKKYAETRRINSEVRSTRCRICLLLTSNLFVFSLFCVGCLFLGFHQISVNISPAVPETAGCARQSPCPYGTPLSRWRAAEVRGFFSPKGCLRVQVAVFCMCHAHIMPTIGGCRRGARISTLTQSLGMLLW